MTKINLGCGPGGVDGWTNYDWGLLPLVNKFPLILKIFVKLGWIDSSYIIKWPNFELFDIRNNFAEKDKSVDFVYCSQVLEHFERWEALEISKEVYRILKKTGVYRVSVPDAKLLYKKYLKNKNADVLAKDIWGFEKNVKPQSFMRRISRWFIRDHQWLYDFDSMKVLLNEAGFKNVNEVNYRTGTTPDLNILDLEDHKPTSMYIEARK